MKVKAKKLTTMILAAVCAMAFGMTAFAAGSASTSGVAGNIISATDANGNAVEITVSETSEPAPSADVLKELLQGNFVEGMRVVDVMDVSVIGDVTFPVTLTFQVPGVTADSNVAVLHYNGTAWEVVPSQAGDGTVTATFESLSPVAIVTDAAAADGAVSGTTSPKTGERAAIAGAGIVALFALTAAVGLKKRTL